MNLESKHYNEYFQLNKINKIKKFYKLKNKIIGFDNNWINNIKLKIEPEIIFKLSNPVNLIIHSIIKKNLKFNKLNFNLKKDIKNFKVNTTNNLVLNFNKNKVKNIILNHNSYSIDFPILLFVNNKILQKLIINKKNPFFITNSNLLKIDNHNFKKDEQIYNQFLFKTKKHKLTNINLLYNTKFYNKTYFNSINLFINFSNCQEPPLRILQSGYFFFNINKENLVINNNILNFFIFNFNKNNLTIPKLNLIFKNYKKNLETFIWWFFFNNTQENLNNTNYQNFSFLNKNEHNNQNFFYLKNSNKINKKNIKNNDKKIKYVSNILSIFYDTYLQFNTFDVIKTNNIVKLNFAKKLNSKKFYKNLNKVKNKIKYYDMNIINNLILLEKYYNQDQYNINNTYRLKENYANKLQLKKKNKKLLNLSFFKIFSFKNKQKVKKITNQSKNNIIKINEYCFSIIRFQNLLKKIDLKYNFTISNTNFNIYNKNKDVVSTSLLNIYS